MGEGGVTEGAGALSATAAAVEAAGTGNTVLIGARAAPTAVRTRRRRAEPAGRQLAAPNGPVPGSRRPHGNSNHGERP